MPVSNSSELKYLFDNQNYMYVRWILHVRSSCYAQVHTSYDIEEPQKKILHIHFEQKRIRRVLLTSNERRKKKNTDTISDRK